MIMQIQRQNDRSCTSARCSRQHVRQRLRCFTVSVQPLHGCRDDTLQQDRDDALQQPRNAAPVLTSAGCTRCSATCLLCRAFFPAGCRGASLVPPGGVLDQQQQRDPGHAHHKLPPLELVRVRHQVVQQVLDPVHMGNVVAQNVLDLCAYSKIAPCCAAGGDCVLWAPYCESCCLPGALTGS